MKNLKLLNRLARVSETPVVPAWMLAAVEGRLDEHANATTEDSRNLKREIVAVENACERLLFLNPVWPLESALL